MEISTPSRIASRRFLDRAMLCLRAVALGVFASILIQFVAWVSIVTAGPIGCAGYAVCISDNLQNSLVAAAMAAIGLIIVAAVVRVLILDQPKQLARPVP